jgi:hypothetical protein
MVATNTAVAEPDISGGVKDRRLLYDYDDGPGGPRSSRAKERAFRRGFLEEARRVVRAWSHRLEEMDRPVRLRPESLAERLVKIRFDPFGQAEAARRLRRRVQERYAVYGAAYGPGCAGRRTYHRGYRSGHEVPAARLRGRHHALEYVLEPLRDLATCDVDVFDPMLLGLWLGAVERWAERPMRPEAPSPPPRPLETPGAADCPAARGRRDEDPSPPGPSEPSPVRRLRLVRADRIEMRPPDWLLRGVLERDTFALVFGDPGCGKSFLAIDWACRVATGTPWRGHAVRGGPVVYVAGEGQQGFGRRIRAWEQHNCVPLADAPLYVAPAVAIPDADQLAELMQALGALDKPPALIVLDTLARCFGGGDENSTQDMNRFVAACDALRRRYGCTILVAHHAGHADKNRARGAIALKAALDAEYRLAGTDNLLLTTTKMKDAETPAPVAMALATVDLPGLADDYGNPVTSAAIEVLDADTGAIESQIRAAARRRGKWQRIGLEVAKRLIAAGNGGQAGVKDWHAECEAAGMRQSTRYDVLGKLHEQGAIVVDGESIVPT